MWFKKKQSKAEDKSELVLEKLSLDAVDRFFQRLADQTPDSSLGKRSYILQSGKIIQYSIYAENGIVEYAYLLAQTAPYHIKGRLSFSLKYLAYIMDANGKLTLWCTDPKVLSAFVDFGRRHYLLCLSKSETEEITMGLCPSIIPVTHKDGTSIVVKDFFDRDHHREVDEYSPELIATIKSMDCSSWDALDLVVHNGLQPNMSKLFTKKQREDFIERFFRHFGHD